MELDRIVCERARRSRDPRFDGRFFLGVRTTGIYCRPVCPAPSPREANVIYFPSAAAAAEAGFRPCLRCRPECSPDAPAWLGSSVTVSRALRLLGEGALDEGSTEDLAQRLGVGARHLRRLFLRHVGAPPVAVAQTRRLHFAKTLIDQTSLPLSQVALASGFGSIRRFNAAFLESYGWPPSEFRRHLSSAGEPGFVISLRYRPPFDWPALLEFLGPRAIPGVEFVEAGRYSRTISLLGHGGSFSVEPGPGPSLRARIIFPEPRALFTIVERIRRLFDLNADPDVIATHLGGDPRLKPLVARHPGLRVPGCWDGFELAVRAILGQQVTVKGATTLAGRIASEFGTVLVGGPGLDRLFPDSSRLVDAPLEQIGVTRSRADCIRSLARAVAEGRLSFDRVADPGSVIENLREIRGIGDWTAQYVAMRALAEPDAFPSTDLGLRKAAGRCDHSSLQKMAQAWRPWRAYAAMYLWQGVRDEHSIVHTDRQPRRTAVAGRR
jgi:AraC family transcriptional regulator, regulatory protein of adaptative response / DNA-3-methyladenine glycosylase II